MIEELDSGGGEVAGEAGGTVVGDGFGESDVCWLVFGGA